MASLYDIGMERATGGTHVSPGETPASTGSAWGRLLDSYTSPATARSTNASLYDRGAAAAGVRTTQPAGAPEQPASGGSPWDRLLNARTQNPPRPPTPRPASGGKVSEQFVIDGLVRRGLPEHVARGFAMNFQDESGFDPGINEANPIVEGSRGGYGLYQLTGPRRRQYEALADRAGRDYSDPELQLDFLMSELQTTESRAFERISQTSNAGEAGAAIVNHFLRPSPDYRQTRANRYLGRS